MSGSRAGFGMVFSGTGPGDFGIPPPNFVQPTAEAEIIGLLKNSKRLRVFGSAHSFNRGVLADDTLISLDRYSGVIWKNAEKKQLAVKAGTRVRDVVAALLDEGLAFAAQPSYDAQSIAGILSMDVPRHREQFGVCERVHCETQADRWQGRDLRMQTDG